MLQIAGDFGRIARAGDDGIELQLLRHIQRAQNLPPLIRLEGATKGGLSGLRRSIVDRRARIEDSLRQIKVQLEPKR